MRVHTTDHFQMQYVYILLTLKRLLLFTRNLYFRLVCCYISTAKEIYSRFVENKCFNCFSFLWFAYRKKSFKYMKQVSVKIPSPYICKIFFYQKESVICIQNFFVIFYYKGYNKVNQCDIRVSVRLGHFIKKSCI